MTTLLEVLNVVQSTSVLNVLAAVFLWAYLKNSKKIESSIAKALGLHNDKFKLSAKRFSDNLDLSSFILQRLEQLRLDIGADRIMIMQYHNGEHSIHGVDFLKFTCTHEVYNKHLATGVKSMLPVQARLLGLPITAYSYVTNLVLNDRVAIIPDIKDLKTEHPSTYNEFKAHGAKSAVIVRLTDLEDNIVGLMIAEYCSTKLNDRPYVANRLVEVGAKISTLLESSGIFQANTEETKINVEEEIKSRFT